MNILALAKLFLGRALVSWGLGGGSGSTQKTYVDCPEIDVAVASDAQLFVTMASDTNIDLASASDVQMDTRVC